MIIGGTDWATVDGGIDDDLGPFPFRASNVIEVAFDTSPPVEERSEERIPVTTFRAWLATNGLTGPMRGDEYKVTFGTDLANKDHLWRLSDHPSAYFEIQVSLVQRARRQEPVSGTADS